MTEQRSDDERLDHAQSHGASCCCQDCRWSHWSVQHPLEEDRRCRDVYRGQRCTFERHHEVHQSSGRKWTSDEQLAAELAVVSKERDDARASDYSLQQQVLEWINRTVNTEAVALQLKAENAALIKERDDARDERDHYERQGSDTLAEWDKMRVERDRLQAELDALGEEMTSEQIEMYGGRLSNPIGIAVVRRFRGPVQPYEHVAGVPVEGDQT